MEKSKLILHHDDPPCEGRIGDDGTCTVCGIHPDMQSLAFHHYCPSCLMPLTRNMKCTKCGKTYEPYDTTVHP